MKEKLKYLIPVIIITALVFPKPTFAFIGTGIFDYFDTALEGVEEFSGPVAKFILILFLYYVIGLGSLFISCSLLQLVLGNLQWLSVINNPMVLSGWSFVAGITNMFFILIFVFIALATILKIETLAAKKLLPKLLLVALLVNFSLIFVGVMIDVSNIFYATIIGGDTDLIPDIFSVLTGSGEDVMVTIIALISVLLLSFMVPFVSPFAQFGLVVLIVATGFIGQLLIWLIQGMMFFLMSGILLLFVFLFAARIFVLQLLAMVAPIAFLCSVLPQTKKYWDDWLKMVVEWNTFGIVTLLFLVVGLRGADALLPPAATATISFSGSTLVWGNIPGYFTYYFFLFVYLVSLLYFSNKYTPQMADMLIRQAKSMGGMIYAKGLKPMGQAATKDARKTWNDWLAKQAAADAEKDPSRLQKWAKSERKILGPVLRRLGRRGVKAGIKSQEKIAKKWEGYTAEQIQAIIGSEGQGLKKRKDFSKYERMIIASRLAEKGGIKKFIKLDEKIQQEIANYAAEKDPKALETILTKGNPNLVNKDSKEYYASGAAEKLGEKVDKEEDPDYKEIYREIKEKEGEENLEEKALAQTVFERTINSIKSSDMKDMKREMFIGDGNEKLRQAMLKRFGPEYWNQIAKHFDQKVMDAFADTRDNMGAEYLAKVNPRTLNYWATYGSDRWGWRKMKGVETKNDVEKLLREARVEKRGLEGVVEEITREQEELNRLLRPHITITEEELDEKVGVKKIERKTKEFSKKFPGRTEGENMLNAKRFLSKHFQKAQRELEEIKIRELKSDPTRLRETKGTMKQKNRERLNEIIRRSNSYQEKIALATQKEEKSQKVEIEKLTPAEKKEIDKMAEKIFEDKERKKTIQRMGEFYNFKPDTDPGKKFAKTWARREATTKFIDEKAKEEGKEKGVKPTAEKGRVSLEIDPTAIADEVVELKKEINEIEKKPPMRKSEERKTKLKEKLKERQDEYRKLDEKSWKTMETKIKELGIEDDEIVKRANQILASLTPQGRKEYNEGIDKMIDALGEPEVAKTTERDSWEWRWRKKKAQEQLIKERPPLRMNDSWPKNIKRMVKDGRERMPKISKLKDKLKDDNKLLENARRRVEELKIEKKEVDEKRKAITPETYKEIEKQIDKNEKIIEKVEKEVNSTKVGLNKEEKRLFEIRKRTYKVIENWEETKKTKERIKELKMPPKVEEKVIKEEFKKIDEEAKKERKAVKKKYKENG